MGVSHGAKGLAAIALFGLVGGMPGKAARAITGVGSLVLIGLVARVGHSGGQLVYKYGAASAYTPPITVSPVEGRR